MPQARNTFGLTMPQPPHSTQPGPPFLSGNQTSTSADGSVNGKKCGQGRVRPRGRTGRAPAHPGCRAGWPSSDPCRRPAPRPGGTPGCGWRRVRRCAEGAADRHDVDRQFAVQQGADAHRRRVGAQHLPTLGRDVERVLACCARGWSGGKFSASKLNCSVSTSGPSATPSPSRRRCRRRSRQDRRSDAGRRWACRIDRQRHVDALGDQGGSVTLGAQRDAVVVRLLRGAAGDVDALAGVGPVFLGQGAQCLTGQRDGRLVPRCSVLARARASRSAACSKARRAASTAAVNAASVSSSPCSATGDHWRRAPRPPHSQGPRPLPAPVCGPVRRSRNHAPTPNRAPSPAIQRTGAARRDTRPAPRRRPRVTGTDEVVADHRTAIEPASHHASHALRRAGTTAVALRPPSTPRS